MNASSSRHMSRIFATASDSSSSPSPSDNTPESQDKSTKAAPLTPESPPGILLEQLILSHPHLVPAAAEQQLEQLAADAEASDAAKEAGGKKSSSDLVLYKRMAEVRSNERMRAIKEVMYALIVQKFIESGAPLLPKVPFVTVDPSSSLFPSAATSPFGLDLVPTVSVKEQELSSVHSEEALDMVKEHLATILGPRPTGPMAALISDDRVVVGTSKLRLGQVYAASIMYGYFLRRVDQRFQLEKSIGLLKGFMGGAGGAGEGEGEEGAQAVVFPPEEVVEEEEVKGESAGEGEGEGGKEGEGEGKLERTLRAYVQSFDSETLQMTATMRSKESVEVIERHTEALFGKPQVEANAEGVAVVKDDAARLTVSTLRRLVLEAVAFGGFLWDVESFVDSRFKITTP
ncbi:hypothetical protein CLOP_g6364 [Closterium sp. NIES-67]|nr:hypothetical protein CLOP_g6364 [Closterium sp. NIES-67]